ncbi:hypothetical protein Acr_04g0010830 [Actinidia rufa]|uniref:Uncharacterized protein n=1 Tax=Actinidia rufa TaxID=165716 RepID=A0A7J0EIP7_9ERIC|nr:hypothetical protein Acr_04g0010830 [Actinidia rufa]
MGSCLSSSSAYHYYIESNGQSSFSTASVISVNGDLRQYTLPVAASQVLRDASSSSGKSFVCNSDGLSYNEYIEAMDEEEQLQEDHIYFLLPASRLQYRVAASDMAALAVKAALALHKSSSNSNKKPKASSSSLIPLCFIIVVVIVTKTKWLEFPPSWTIMRMLIIRRLVEEIMGSTARRKACTISRRQ